MVGAGGMVSAGGWCWADVDEMIILALA